MEPEEDAARLLERVADDVPVAPAPVARLVDAARRARRRRRLRVALLLLLVLAAVVVATTGT